ncbi:MAG TPA: hypothetical protein VN648_15075 [Candidatus Methylomirabilis sp.]|nr:hypothetical protein [Candidatus Methylomirabilis sp.]
MLEVGERNSIPLVGWAMAGSTVVVDAEPLVTPDTVVDGEALISVDAVVDTTFVVVVELAVVALWDVVQPDSAATASQQAPTDTKPALRSRAKEIRAPTFTTLNTFPSTRRLLRPNSQPQF